MRPNFAVSAFSAKNLAENPKKMAAGDLVTRFFDVWIKNAHGNDCRKICYIAAKSAEKDLRENPPPLLFQLPILPNPENTG